MTVFFTALNSLHVFLTFTFEKETDDKLLLLDVVVEKADSEFFTSVYQKPTFTGQCTPWIPLVPPQKKKNKPYWSHNA